MIDIYLEGEISKYKLDPITYKVYGSRGEVKPVMWSRGYLMYSFNHFGKKVRVLVHRLIADYMISPLKKGDTINHIDGNKLNNSPDNLEIISIDENIKHAFATGLCIGTPFREIVATKGEEKKRFRSINQCATALNLNSGAIHTVLSRGYGTLKGWHINEIKR